MNTSRITPALASVIVLLSSLSAQPQNRTGLVQVTDRAWGWLAKNDRSSNSALFIGDDSALIVDPGLTPSTAQEFLTSVGEVSDIRSGGWYSPTGIPITVWELFADRLRESSLLPTLKIGVR